MNELITYNPANGEELGRVPVYGPQEVSDAVAAARKCFDIEWRNTDFSHRRQLMFRAREIILGELDTIAKLIAAETGKPFGEAIAMEIAPALDLMRWIAIDAGKILRPRKIPIGLYTLLGRSSQVIYKPLGVIGIIPAWNYPFSIPLGEAAMALMAGNTAVIKPSELTPLTGLKIGEIFMRAGFPADAVKIVTGDGSTGEALVRAAPDKIMFTGSVATGRKILAAAAENMIPVVLELGGKDPMIVFEDADLDLAAAAAVWGAFCNSGQSCSSVERLYAHESIAVELTKKIIEKTRMLKQGDPMLEDVSIGAMSSERQIRIVENHVDYFRESGAEIAIGGRRNPEQEANGHNLFYLPTVITGAANDMHPMREETFGPTLPIATFRTEEEAIRLANDSRFGLTASVWTRDYRRGRRVAKQIEAGTVCINEVLYTHGIGQTPWGGVKNSGRGRTHGAEGMLELVWPQHIHTNRIALLPDAWWMPYSPVAVETFRGFARRFASGSIFRVALLLPQLLRRLRELI
jgi:acyl-CoA reductase-like NAD-dependent aldehyde dehydrogenase